MNWIRTSLVIIIIAIIYLSLKSPSDSIEIKINDKIGHLIAYCVLTVNAGLLFPSKKWWLVVVSAFVMSAIMEYLQSFVPGRFTDWKDLVANGSGALIGWLILILFCEKIMYLLKWLRIVKKTGIKDNEVSSV